jgi:ribosome biogenesis GTPase / thiamine phosphate phosphatase
VRLETHQNQESIMDQDQAARLRGIGFGPVLARRVEEHSGSGLTEPMRVVEVNRETLRLHRGDAECRARVLPRLVRDLEQGDTALAVGDWVLTRRDAYGGWWVQEQLPPLSHIARRDADGRPHAVVSNVDTALLLMGLDDDFNLRRLERFLALVQENGVRPVIVLTKADIAAAAPPRIESCLEALQTRLPGGVDVIVVNATAAAAAAALEPYLAAGQTLVMLGSSGAGKSTLTNTLLGASVQDTGPVRERDLRGQHTTTSRCLFRLAGGACIIDTPGVRTLRPLGSDEAMAASFSDIARLRMTCRFRDCRHAQEPGCAVRDGVDADRLRNYHKLLREARRETLSPLQRREQLAEWKARAKVGSTRLKAKRGEA